MWQVAGGRCGQTRHKSSFVPTGGHVDTVVMLSFRVFQCTPEYFSSRLSYCALSTEYSTLLVSRLLRTPGYIIIKYDNIQDDDDESPKSKFSNFANPNRSKNLNLSKIKIKMRNEVVLMLALKE